MKFRMLVSTCALFALVFSMTIGFYSTPMADEDTCTNGRIDECDCCQVHNVVGAWRKIGEGAWVCSCTGCDVGATGNPCECDLFCPPQQ